MATSSRRRFNLYILICSCVWISAAKHMPKSLVPDVTHSTRIVGGEAAKRGEFKAQVSLQNRYRSSVCGGTMIDERHIITAAHCYQSRNIIVHVMGDDLVVSKSGSASRQIRLVENFVTHPNYDVETLDNDIAIIRIDAPFKTTPSFSPVSRSKETPKVGEKCQAVGWGLTDYESDASTSVHLLKVNVEVFETSDCNGEDSYDGMLTSSMFCAGDKKGNHDACQGDSGGLLTCDGKSLTGVISFGFECGLSDFPGVYTDVSKFNDWIDETIARTDLPEYEFALKGTTVDPTEDPTTIAPPSTPPGGASNVIAPISVLIVIAFAGQLFISSVAS